MSIDEEKKEFVIKHTYLDVTKLIFEVCHFGGEETHFKAPWQLTVYRPTGMNNDNLFETYFRCLKYEGEGEWSIAATIKTKYLTNEGVKFLTKTHVFTNDKFLPLTNHVLYDGDMTIECHVTIHKMTGFREISRKFDESMEKFSDVVLKVKNQKFYVNKMYLAAQSTYFEALFMRDFEESKQSEVEIKNIRRCDFQNFLEVIYGEPIIDEDNIKGILQLADFFDVKTAIRQCEDFLLHKSRHDLKLKLNVAVKYGMEKLKKKCMSEIKTVKDIKLILPEDITHFDKETLGELLKLAIASHRK